MALGAGLVVLLIGAGLPAQPAAARPSPDGPWVVHDYGDGRGSVAGHPIRQGVQNLRSLIRDWGPPRRLEPRRGGCRATWARPAAVVLAGSYAVPPGPAQCSPRRGMINSITTVGVRWRTDRGLRVGDPEAAVASLYPSAVPRHVYALGRAWLLRPYETVGVEGVPVEVSGVYAAVSGQAVRSFTSLIGAQGE